MSMPLDPELLRLYSPIQMEEDESPELRLWSETTRLGLLTGDDLVDEETEGEEASPMIVKFRRPVICERPRTQEQLLSRMKTVYRNRCCRHCSSQVVVPVQRNDAELDRNGMPIPGTATLIGFRCKQCSAEWRV